MPNIPEPSGQIGPEEVLENIKLLIKELYEQRIGGAYLGDVFRIGSSEVLYLALYPNGGLEKVQTGTNTSLLKVKVKSDGGLYLLADGLAVKRKYVLKGTVWCNTIDRDEEGLYVKIKPGGGLDYDEEGIYVTSAPWAFIHAVRTVSADYTITDSDNYINVDASSANITITLPTTADVVGRSFLVKKIDSSANSVTIQTASALEKIEGNTTYVLSTQYAYVRVYTDGSNWFIESEG